MAKRRQSAKKGRRGRPWWRRWKRRYTVTIVALVAVAAGLGVWLVLGAGGGSGGKEESQYLREPAPAFALPTIAGDQVSLADHVGRHNLLLFFNEGMGCGPCFDQIVDLEKDWGRFEALDVALVSIMVDSLPELAAEAESRGITGIVASDRDKSVSEAYDAMQASMHPGVKPGHSFILVNKAGEMIWRWDWVGHGKPMYYEVDEIYGHVAKWLERAG